MTQEEYKDIILVRRIVVRKAKAQIDLTLAKDVNSNKNGS